MQWRIYRGFQRKRRVPECQGPKRSSYAHTRTFRHINPCISRGPFRSRIFGQGYLPWIGSVKSSFTAPDPWKPAPPVWRPNTRGKDSEMRKPWGEGSTHGGPPVIHWCLAPPRKPSPPPSTVRRGRPSPGTGSRSARGPRKSSCKASGRRPVVPPRRLDPLKLPGRAPPLWDVFCPDPFPDYGPQ